MEKLLKDNLIYIVALLGILIGGFIGVSKLVTSFIDNTQELNRSLKTKEENEQKLHELEERKKSQVVEKKSLESGKVIFEVSQLQFSPEASFGIMFENIISNLTSTGVRVRSIDYNYHPAEDKILEAGSAGYNACELSFTTVATYTQLQLFFKNLARERYLSEIFEIIIEPYDKDKTILIAKFKIRLYTKSV